MGYPIAYGYTSVAGYRVGCELFYIIGKYPIRYTALTRSARPGRPVGPIRPTRISHHSPNGAPDLIGGPDHLQLQNAETGPYSYATRNSYLAFKYSTLGVFLLFSSEIWPIGRFWMLGGGELYKRCVSIGGVYRRELRRSKPPRRPKLRNPIPPPHA